MTASKKKIKDGLNCIDIQFPVNPVVKFHLLYPPQTLFVGGILFSRCPSVRPSVRNALFP